MKKGILGIFVLVLILQLISIVTSAGLCPLETVLLNQDPYPAIPGETIKVVFQITGISNPDCGDIRVDLKESFPFKLDPEHSSSIVIKSGTYLKDFDSFLLVPYKLQINEDALDGESKLELNVSSGFATMNPSFNIEIKDLRTDFEITVKEYNPKTNILTFQILNSGENDVEALTVDIPKQDFLNIKGSSRTIVGSLDSNDDTTFSLEAVPKEGDLKLIITYTDGINERRTIEKLVSYNPDLFIGRVGTEEGISLWFYITLILVAAWIFQGYRNRQTKKRQGHSS